MLSGNNHITGTCVYAVPAMPRRKYTAVTEKSPTRAHADDMHIISASIKHSVFVVFFMFSSPIQNLIFFLVPCFLCFRCVFFRHCRSCVYTCSCNDAFWYLQILVCFIHIIFVPQVFQSWKICYPSALGIIR